MTNVVTLHSAMSTITLQNNDTITFNKSLLIPGPISSQLSSYERLNFYIIPTVPYYQILPASFEPNTRTLSIPYVAKANKKPFRLHVFQGIVQESNAPHAEQWVESLMKTVYEGRVFL